MTMIGLLSECILLSYRTPVGSVRSLVPRQLELVTHGDWAFWNIVACRIESMRPTGVPRVFGIAYHHVAYRLYVRAQTRNGTVLDGLYFVQSNADSRVMVMTGNLLSDFQFHFAPVELSGDSTNIAFSVKHPKEAAHCIARQMPAFELQPGSCFNSPEEAKAFLKYRPVGIAIDGAGKQLKLAEVIRDETAWEEVPLTVESARWQFLKGLGQAETHLELATRVRPIEYRWRLGKKVAV